MQIDDIKDKEAVLKCQAGDGRFFGELYDRYSRPVYNFLYFRTRHKETAEDLTSQVFFKALGNIQKFDFNKGKFVSWIFQIAKNSLIDHYRTNRPTEDIETVWDLSSAHSPQKETELNIDMEKLFGYLAGISRQQREILIMRLWDGFTHKQIAEILGLSEANSKTIFSRCLAQIQKDSPLAVLALAALKNYL